VQRRINEAEDAYLTQLTDSRMLEVEEGAVDVARDLARKPGTRLSGRQAQRTLVSYTDGSLTAGEYLDLMQQRPPQQRSAVASLSDEQLADWLRLLARDEILIEEARRQGFSIPEAEQDSARMELRRQLLVAAREAGVVGDSAMSAAQLQQQVLALLNGIVNGQRNVVPIGAASFILREKYGAEIFERAIPVVVSQVQERRPAVPQGMPEGMPMPPQTPPQTPPDTTG